ncbi:MAG TPA: hypothetical protein VEK57_00185 [Thermoanaerobaculia bacterium]|nr:hypothetical protein [Thermoanaerobaculia bacterium]
MTSVQLSELGPTVADAIRNGETVEVRDGDHVVAHIVPVQKRTPEERIDGLTREGR